ncbi:C40 family peptidase [Paenibacillus sp. HB172176]|uniref:C40 family peptidase n=1 Tax=Paenibacillus sp. HB172176 TaxID=2493690 RepID=UPI00143B9771|nr:C40 family peptidase [Paenibacillus sp. HB172176]
MRNWTFFKKFIKIGACSTILFSAMTFATLNTSTVHAATATSLKLLDSSKDYIGTPYLFGSAPGSTRTFDCSSFTQYIFKGFHVWLPRTSAGQASMGEKVAKGYLSVGDLVFFNTNGRSISHVAIYAGNGKIIHCSSSHGVTISDMNTSYWKSRYVTARRVL